MKRLLLFITLLGFVSFSYAETFVLVHGAWMGQFAWDEVKANLEQAGNTVITVELPGHGDDMTPVAELTLESYKQAVLAAIGEQTDIRLVGHSAGGVVISEVAEAIPTQLSKLIFVAAYLPRSGESVFSLSGEDKDSQTGQYLMPDNPEQPTVLGIQQAAFAELFCADCSAEHQSLATQKLRPEAVAPLATPVTLTEQNFGSVPKFYVETLQDRVVSNSLQKLMLSRTPVAKSVAIDSSHSPFFSRAQELSEILGGF